MLTLDTTHRTDKNIRNRHDKCPDSTASTINLNGAQVNGDLNMVDNVVLDKDPNKNTQQEKDMWTLRQQS